MSVGPAYIHEPGIGYSIAVARSPLAPTFDSYESTTGVSPNFGTPIRAARIRPIRVCPNGPRQVPLLQ